MHPHGRGRFGPHAHPRIREIVPDENGPVSHRIHYALRVITREQRQLIFGLLSEKGTHPGQAFSLWALSGNEGMTQSELADALSVKRPTVSIMLKKMEKAGLVERKTDEDDRRVARTYLTEKGRALQSELETVHAQVMERTVGDMSEDDQNELARLLGMVRENLRNARGDDNEDTDISKDDE